MVDLSLDLAPVSNIAKTIEEGIPNFVTKPITFTIDKLEKFRKNINIIGELENKKIKNEIKSLNALEKNKITSNSKTTINSFLKPFKYVELFFLSISLFILNNKIIFYGILLIIIFIILRYIWNKIH